MLRAFVASLAILVFAPIPAWAGKTVNVRGYTRKDGTYVSPHTRSSPGSGSSFSSEPVFVPPPVVPRTEYRTSYRTSPVTTARTDYPKLQPADESKATVNTTNAWARDDRPEDNLSEKKTSAKSNSSKRPAAVSNSSFW